MELYLTRQLNGLYMLTLYPPIFAKVGTSDHMDAYVQPGEPIGIRHLCDRILIVVNSKPLKRCESIKVELNGNVLKP